MRPYVVDSSAFIQAARDWYPRDVFPTLWEKLKSYGAYGLVLSIDAVKDELLQRNDDLADWAKNEFCGWRPAKNDQQTMKQYQKVAKYVEGLTGKSRAEKDRFMSGADGWLVAWAVVNYATVVAHETSTGTASKKIKIPDVCTAFNVKCIRLVDMLRQLKVQI